MNAVIEKVYSMILGCGGSDKENKEFQKCIRNRVKAVVADGMALVASKKFSKKKVKQMIEDMVRASLLECAESVRGMRGVGIVGREDIRDIRDIEITKDCIARHSTDLISIAVDIMTFLM